MTEIWLGVPPRNTTDKPTLPVWPPVPVGKNTLDCRIKRVFVTPRLGPNNEPREFGPDGKPVLGVNRRTLLAGAGAATMAVAAALGTKGYLDLSGRMLEAERETQQKEVREIMAGSGLAGIDSAYRHIDPTEIVDFPHELSNGIRSFTTSRGAISDTEASDFWNIEIREYPNGGGIRLFYDTLSSDGKGNVRQSQLCIHTSGTSVQGLSIGETLGLFSNRIPSGLAYVEYVGVEQSRTPNSAGGDPNSTGLCVRDSDSEHFAMAYSPNEIITAKPGDEKYRETARTALGVYNDTLL